MTGNQGSEERYAEYAATLVEKLKGYERILSKQKYLAGDVSDPAHSWMIEKSIYLKFPHNRNSL